MKPFFIAALLVGILAPCRAQIITVDLTGKVSSISGPFDSTVQVGDILTEALTIHAGTPISSSGSGFASYDDPAGFGSFSVGDMTINGIGSSVSINSNYFGVWSYTLEVTLPNKNGQSSVIDAVLASTTTPVAPDTSLSSLQDFPTSISTMSPIWRMEVIFKAR